MKQLTESDYKQIILRRDPRYDGRLFFGVKTTKIYCRPVCPARPKFENIVIYKSKSEAEKAGCRACLRCRPDLAPGNRFISPGKDFVSKGLSLIEETSGGRQSMETIAKALGISGRHLRRVFEEHLGASPIEIMQTQRLHNAKHLLVESNEPISDIAFATGFNSIRRFNEAVKAAYRMTPSKIRTTKEYKAAEKDGIALTLMVRKPYCFSTVLAFLQRHAAGGIEEVTGKSYVRYVPGEGALATIQVTMNKRQDALQVQLKGFQLAQIFPVLLKVRRLFDIDHNPVHLPLAPQTRQAGVRVPGSFNPFETAISIILSQLVSIKQATAKLSELIRRFGRVIEDNRIYSFPDPAGLMTAEVEQIGITRSKATAIRILSGMVHKQEFHFSYGADFGKIREQLLSIKGIGPWTTEMILMRCFGNADAFPENDLIIKRALEGKLIDEALWKTNRAYMTHYVWNEFAETLSNGIQTKKKLKNEKQKTKKMKICYQEISSPIGQIYIVADNTSLKAIIFACNWEKFSKVMGEIVLACNEIIIQTETQLRGYFAKERRKFNLPILFNSGTKFQQQAWQALLTIPYGETRSYSEQAQGIGNPKAVRAVGRANALNPLPIVVPCHRVIGKNGTLTGFAGGLENKRYLLHLEGVL